MSRRLVLLAWCAIAIGCGRERGMSCSGTVRFSDSSPVPHGEVWLEPDEPPLRNRRPQRVPIVDGAFHFPPAAGIQSGRWVARIYPPPLGSISTPEDMAASFEESHESVTIQESAPSEATLEFTVRRRGESR